MERSVEIATGESVAFSYELAGLGSRFFAVFIDLTIQVAVTVGAFLLFLWLANLAPRTGWHVSFPKFLSERAIAALLFGLFYFAIFVVYFGYFIVFEWRWAGRTPGKRLLGIRVVRDGGFPLDFTSSVVRNLVRILEAGFGFYAVSALSTLLSPLNRRLGDLAAGTIVVRDGRFERDRLRSWETPLAEAHDLSEPERDLIRRYVERRMSLGHGARGELATRIASAIRPKLSARYEHLDDDALLVHLAHTG